MFSLLIIMDKPMKALLKLPTTSLTDLQLSDVCTYQNTQYRQGDEVLNDDEFELVYMSALRERLPGHPLLNKPQSTLVSGTGLIAHNKPMLSTDKAYTIEDLEKYVSLCEKYAELNNIDIASLMYRITPKLDGIAADYRKHEHLMLTRGEDGFGENFSLLLDKGLHIVGDTCEDNLTGEVVVLREYFDQHILGQYKNPQNYMGGVVNRIINSNNTNKITDLALKAKAIHFVVFNSVEGITVDRDSLIHSIEHIAKDMKDSCPYLTDGTVIDVYNNNLKEKMGHNGRFHLWQIAKKTRGVTAT
jgi:DNA ligase (NAD+)